MDHVGQFSVKSESINIIMSVSDPKGREIAKEMGQKKMQAIEAKMKDWHRNET